MAAWSTGKIVLFLLLVFALWIVQLLPEAVARDFELRGAWLDTRSIPSNREGIRSIVDILHESGFNAIFVESYYHSRTLYPSSYLESLGMERQMPAFEGFDPLDSLIEEARSRSMQVHVWLHLFYAGLNDPGPLLSRFPEWKTVNRDGSTGYTHGGNHFYWVSPFPSGVADFYAGLVQEIMENYAIDGIQLDYIRFPDPVRADAGYSMEVRQAFLEKHGVDPIDLDPLQNKELFRAWNEFRSRAVDRVVEHIAHTVRAQGEDVLLSASVMTRGMPIELNSSYLQDWPRWAENRYLDMLIPMAYSSRVNEMRGMLLWVNHFLRDNIPMYAGLQAFNLHSPQELALQVDAARSMGAQGVVIFAWPYLTGEVLEALGKGPFAEIALAPPRSALVSAFTSPVEPVSYSHSHPRRIRARYISQKPVIDGRITENIWQEAEWQGDFSLITGEEAASEQTEIAAAWDEENLYIAFRAKDPSPERMKATITERDGPVFYDDSVEVFIDPGRTRSFYYHLAVNTLGTQYDSHSLKGVNFQGEWHTAATVDEAGYTVEMLIPFSDLEYTPSAGELWGINFNRNTVSSGEFSGWSFTPGTFHAPSFFGDIEFSPPGTL